MVLQSKIIIAIVGLIVVGTAGAVVYRSEQRRVESVAPLPETSSEVDKAVGDQDTAVKAVAPTPKSAETAPASKTAMSPKEIFINFYAEINKANTYADVASVFLKYGSKDRIASVEYISNPNAVSEEERDKVFRKAKIGAAYCIGSNDIQETIKGSTATATATTNSSQFGEGACTLYFVLENNQWKVN